MLRNTCLALAALVGGSATVRADVTIVDNLPPGGRYLATGSAAIQRIAAAEEEPASEQHLAASFVTPPGGPLALAELRLAMFRDPGDDGGFRITVVDDDGGAPGDAVLDQIVVASGRLPLPSLSTLAPIVVTSVRRPVLAPSTAYWLVFTPAAPAPAAQRVNWAQGGTGNVVLGYRQNFDLAGPPGPWLVFEDSEMLRVDAGPAHQATDDDGFDGAAIAQAAPGTSGADALVDGTRADAVLLPDVGAGHDAAIDFDTAAIALRSLRLFAGNDGVLTGYQRSMSRFQLFADLDDDGAFAADERVVDQPIEHGYDAGQDGDLDGAPGQLEMVFDLGGEITARRWRLVVTQAVAGPAAGVRIQELDGIGTLLPSSSPLAVADGYAIDEDAVLVVAAPGVLANDGDPDGDALTCVPDGDVAHGVLGLGGDGSFRYAPVHDYAGADGFTYRADDGTSASDPVVVAITVNPINDAPVNSVPGPQHVALGLGVLESVTFALATADVDAGAAPLRVTLTATNGTITLARTTDLGFSAGDGTSDTTMTFTGALPAINAALAGVRYTPALLTFLLGGGGAVQIITNDLGNSGAPGPRSDTDTVAITRG